MRTVVVAGTAGGVGVTTLAALALASAGRPWVLGPQHADTAARSGAGGAEPATDAAVWDAGVLRTDAALQRPALPDLTLALVAPATPLGVADADRVLLRVADADPGLVARSCLVLTAVHGRAVPSVRTAAPVVVLRVPFDRALAAPGPVPADRVLAAATNRAVQEWRGWVERALRPGS